MKQEQINLDKMNLILWFTWKLGKQFQLQNKLPPTKKPQILLNLWRLLDGKTNEEMEKANKKVIKEILQKFFF